MTKYLLEVPHDAEESECARAVQTFLQTGSHFLMNADWGCSDGEHKAWLILETDSREDAVSILPPSMRPQASIVRLNKYTWKDIEEHLPYHSA